VHLTLGILRHFQAFFYALSFFQSDGVPPPAPAQVTQTVGWQRQRAKPKPSSIHKFLFVIGSEIHNRFLAAALFKQII
jgi:hypothetical protein